MTTRYPVNQVAKDTVRTMQNPTPRGSISRRMSSALLLGGVCALIGSLFLLSPFGWALEESVGLRWLFQARGPQPAPADVTVVAITKDASDALDVSYEPKRWPRILHTELVGGLHRAGARTITFDLLFAQDRGEADGGFAAAIKAAGNVVLLEFLEKRIVEVAGTADQDAALLRRVPPTASIAAAALATAPFTLPKVPLHVAQFWTFDRNAGDAVSLPLAALLVYAGPTFASLWEAVEASAPELAGQLVASSGAWGGAHAYIDSAETLAAALRRLPRLPEEILRRAVERGASRTDRELIESVLDAVADPPSRYLNFYGPPWSVRTIPYDEALRELSVGPKPDAWSEHAVFVGLSSPVQWEQMDEFTTPFSDPDTGHDLSGIEILATAFANLRDRTYLRPLATSRALILVLGWGLLVGLLARLTTPLWAAVALLALCAAYFYTALRLFSDSYVWLPLVTPLMAQAPLALFIATTSHYRAAKRDRLRIRELFGYYLPEAVVERLVREGFHPGQDRESVFGVCLYSDAAQYTTLSESMASEQLATYMNSYYEVIFEPVRRHGGIVSDVVGDAMMAIWAARSNDREIRAAACQAALEILDAVKQRNASGEGPMLATRIGLHCGAMTMAHVGAGDHFEYRAVGDIVNAASRLEGLNKELGTSVLVSADTVAGLDNIVSRPLGSHRLAGKQTPIEVNELIGLNRPAAESDAA